MLRFTKRADYGLMAINYIVLRGDEGAVSAKRIADEFGIPPELLAKILQDEWATIADDYHWHLEIVVQPERATRVGGIAVNEVPPEEAAHRLREAWRT